MFQLDEESLLVSEQSSETKSVDESANVVSNLDAVTNIATLTEKYLQKTYKQLGNNDFREEVFLHTNIYD